MPLVRFAVKNEYGLGVEELYKDGVESEDPKAVLDGVAVAGLVGVLRQLGDLAQFAAEVFHGLQEQVASTSSRSRKLVSRVQRIEASLPSIEKAILSQTDHLRFAYTPGSERHAYIRTERNLFICDDLPHFVMDSYEECREPPRLQLLDRFDSGGSGSCLKRYSDPTFFKKASSCSELSNSEKSKPERKARKIKKRRSRQQSGQLPIYGPNMNGSSRMQFSSTGHGQYSLSHTGSTVDITFKSDVGGQSDSRGSKDGLDYIECVSRPSISTQHEERKNNELLEVYTNRSVYLDEENSIASGDKLCSHAVEETVHCSSSATWDELLEIVEPRDVNYEIENTRQVPVTHSALLEPELVLVNEKGINQVNDLSEQGSNQHLEADALYLRTTNDENTMKPTGLNFRINLGQSLIKTDFDLQEHHSELSHLKSSTPVVDLFKDGKPVQPSIDGNLINYPVSRRLGTGDAKYFLETNFDFDDKKWEMINSEHANAVDAFTENATNVRALEWNVQDTERVNAEHVSQVDASCEDGNNVNIIEWNELGPEAVNPILVTQGDAISEGENNVKVIEWNRQKLGTVTAEHVCEMDTFSEGGNSVKLISWNQWELESQNSENVSEVDTFTEGGNSVQLIEWNQIDDIDSGTENFVDALNTIESESESDFEAEMRKEVITTGSVDELGRNAVHGQTSEIVESENQSPPTSYDHEDGAENSERSAFSVSAANMLSPKDELGDNVVNGRISEITSHVEPKHQHLTTSNYRKEGLEDLERSTVSVTSVNKWSPKDELGENVVDGQISETSSVQSKHQRLATSYDCKEGPNRSTTPVSATDMWSPDHNWSSHDKSDSAAAQKVDALTCLSEEQPVQSSQSATLSVVPQGIDIGVNVPVTGVESALCENGKAGFDALSDEKTICGPHISQEVSVRSSTSDPVSFWTNGTLFGLAPSKPIVFSMPNSVDSAPTINDDIGVQCSPDAIQEVNSVGKLDSSLNKSELGNESYGYGPKIGSSNHLSLQRLENRSMDHDEINARNHPVMLDPSNGDAMPLESTVPVGTSTSEDRSSLLSVFSRGLLKNGLHRSRSLFYNETQETLKTNKFDNKCQNTISLTVPETNLEGKLNSPVHSPPPSPPLEHMKIAFQPVDGFDMSRLKLKYPEGVDQYENSLDAFPTFQLVPEFTKLQHDIGSDSDDDTFCRSYAYMSDESHSHISDSNSEQWESGGSIGSNDHILYSGLHRFSSSKSASISPQLEEPDPGNIYVGSGSISDVHSLSTPLFGLPTLDACNPLGFQEMKLGLNQALDSSHLQEQTHEPPPLPPMQWRVSRLMFDEVKDNQYQGPDSLSQSFVPKISNSAVERVDSAKLISTTQESPTFIEPQKVKVQKSGQEQTYHAEKEKGMDDEGDFLHQIRTKSFNLKRTEPTRSSYTPLSSTSNKVTAILQKANAIRQAVGSDDGEDDSWSDT